MFENFEKLNFVQMSRVSLTKWLRDNSEYRGTRLGLREAMEVERLIREAYRLGEIRGKTLA